MKTWKWAIEWERVFRRLIKLFGVHINSPNWLAQKQKGFIGQILDLNKSECSGGVHSDIPQPKDEEIVLKDILEEEVVEKVLFE